MTDVRVRRWKDSPGPQLTSSWFGGLFTSQRSSKPWWTSVPEGMVAVPVPPPVMRGWHCWWLGLSLGQYSTMDEFPVWVPLVAVEISVVAALGTPNAFTANASTKMDASAKRARQPAQAGDDFPFAS